MALEVLLVDDSAIMRGAIRDMLRTVPGCIVVGEGANGFEALELARTLQPNLIVMDIQMPLMRGLEALRLLKSERTSAQVVLVTAVLEAEVREAALSYGAIDCLEKGADLWDNLTTLVSALSNS